MLKSVSAGLKPALKGYTRASGISTSLVRGMAATVSQYSFESLKVTKPSDFVYHVEINRPEKRNAMNTAFWKEMVQCFDKISVDSDCRAVVFSGAGKMFSAGIDLQSFSTDVVPSPDLDHARRAVALNRIIEDLQNSFTVIEKCSKPVIAAIHSACIGAGVDLICACDIRYCTEDAWFQVKEVDLGLAADLGTLQRFPKIVGNESLVRELCFTARVFKADEAKTMGLVSRTFAEKDKMLASALEVAALIASKSPVAVQATKEALVYARDHSVDESLRQLRALNQTYLQSEDVMKSIAAMMTKEQAVFAKL